MYINSYYLHTNELQKVEIHKESVLYYYLYSHMASEYVIANNIFLTEYNVKRQYYLDAYAYCKPLYIFLDAYPNTNKLKLANWIHETLNLIIK